MDISKDYIEMCSKAQEIQGLKNKYINKDNKDFFYVIDKDGIYTPCIKSKFIYVSYGKIVWLPRQDQLQEITELTPLGCVRLLRHTVEEVREGEYDKFISMERIWLAIVMDCIYDKKWNPEIKEWEKE